MLGNPDQADADGDVVGDECDNCVDDVNADQADSDFDGTGDACVLDDDGDGVCDARARRTRPSAPRRRQLPDCGNPDQEDSDGDGIGDSGTPVDPARRARKTTDGDGVGDLCDSGVDVENFDQADLDEDGEGDACDDDDDGDNAPDATDLCPMVATAECTEPTTAPVAPASTATARSISTRTATGWGFDCDNCPRVADDLQEDLDLDGYGDACDNCPLVENPPPACEEDEECVVDGQPGVCEDDGFCNDQANHDSDGRGDACDDIEFVDRKKNWIKKSLARQAELKNRYTIFTETSTFRTRNHTLCIQQHNKASLKTAVSQNEIRIWYPTLPKLRTNVFKIIFAELLKKPGELKLNAICPYEHRNWQVNTALTTIVYG